MTDLSGMREKESPARPSDPSIHEPDTPFRRKCRMTWAALIKAVYEVDPLKCPKCGGEMKIIGFIEETATVEKILRHCNLWREPVPRPPPKECIKPSPMVEEPVLEYSYFEQNCL